MSELTFTTRINGFKGLSWCQTTDVVFELPWYIMGSLLSVLLCPYLFKYLYLCLWSIQPHWLVWSSKKYLFAAATLPQDHKKGQDLRNHKLLEDLPAIWKPLAGHKDLSRVYLCPCCAKGNTGLSMMSKQELIVRIFPNFTY